MKIDKNVITSSEEDISNLDFRAIIYQTKINYGHGNSVESTSQIHIYADASQDNYIQVATYVNISKLERFVQQRRLKNDIVDVRTYLSFAATVFCNDIILKKYKLEELEKIYQNHSLFSL